MDDQEIQGPDVFEHWLEEEQAYLCALAKEPVHETLKIDYYLALVNLETAVLEQHQNQQAQWHTQQ